MRPIRLELEGFGPFRDRIEIDLDAELFVLVGPTGSGKSSIIDGICFALYGTVPRYGDLRAIEPVISAQSTEARVRLDFEVEGQLHTVVRIARRLTGGRASVREARLERGEVVLAGKVRELNEAIEQLIGLTFEQFTRTVVLPQGQVSAFLHAEPSKRQELLVRLLDAGVYREIGQRARRLADEQRQRVELLDEQLDRLGVDPDELLRVRRRVGEHERLIADLDQLATQVAQARSRSEHLSDRRHELVELDSALPRAVPEPVTRAAERLRRIADQRAQVRSVRDTLVQRAGRLDDELASHTPRPHLEARLDARRRIDALAAEAQRLATALDELADVTPTWRALDATEAEARRRGDELAALAAAVSRPLPERLDAVELARQADAEAAGADQLRLESDQAERQARARMRPSDESEADRQALQRWADRERLAEQLDQARAEQAQCAAAARSARSDADERRARARSSAAASEHQHALELLRPGLTPGQPCPLCEQAVAQVPSPAPSPVAIGPDEQAVEAAEREAVRAEQRAESATEAVDRLSAQLDALVAQMSGDDPAPTIRARLDDDTHRRQAHEQAVTARDAAIARAGQAADRARRARRRADEVAAQVAEWRRPLLALAPPESTAELAHWCEKTRAELIGEQAAVAAELEQVSVERKQVRDRLAVLGAGDDDDPVTLIGRAQGRRDQSLAESRQLADTLDPTRSANDDRIELDRVIELDEQRRRLAVELDEARAELDTLEADEAEHEGHLAELAAELTRVRDAVAAAGPPTPSGEVGADWAALVAWADEQHQVLGRQIDELDEQRRQLDDQIEALAARATHRAAQAGLEAAGDPTELVEAARRARSEAEAELRVLSDRAGQAERLGEDRRAATERLELAGELGRLMRADRFEDWLLGAATDQLVESATERLRELSSGAYSLAAEGRELVVVDHRNADETRSVRTLSGGETFLASLALALALADGVAQLAAAGAPRLETIFLDEGFGSLDAETLDVVAAAIEELGASGRSVGVVTHVRDLAERIPVRYEVRRGPTSSTVRRVQR